MFKSKHIIALAIAGVVALTVDKVYANDGGLNAPAPDYVGMGHCLIEQGSTGETMKVYEDMQTFIDATFAESVRQEQKEALERDVRQGVAQAWEERYDYVDYVFKLNNKEQTVALDVWYEWQSYLQAFCNEQGYFTETHPALIKPVVLDDK